MTKNDDLMRAVVARDLKSVRTALAAGAQPLATVGGTSAWDQCTAGWWSGLTALAAALTQDERDALFCDPLIIFTAPARIRALLRAGVDPPARAQGRLEIFAATMHRSRSCEKLRTVAEFLGLPPATPEELWGWASRFEIEALLVSLAPDVDQSARDRVLIDWYGVPRVVAALVDAGVGLSALIEAWASWIAHVDKKRQPAFVALIENAIMTMGNPEQPRAEGMRRDVM